SSKPLSRRLWTTPGSVRSWSGSLTTVSRPAAALASLKCSRMGARHPFMAHLHLARSRRAAAKSAREVLAHALRARGATPLLPGQSAQGGSLGPVVAPGDPLHGGETRTQPP